MRQWEQACGKPEVAPESGVIWSRMETAFNLTEELSKAIGNLEVRCGLVLRPVPPSGESQSNKEVKAADSELGGRLETLVARLSDLDNHIRHIHSRVDL